MQGKEPPPGRERGAKLVEPRDAPWGAFGCRFLERSPPDNVHVERLACLGGRAPIRGWSHDDPASLQAACLGKKVGAPTEPAMRLRRR